MATSPKKKRMSLAEAEELARRDKRRILLLSIGAIVLLAAFLYAQLEQHNRQIEEQESRQVGIEDTEPEARPASLPDFDAESQATIDAVRDDTESARLVPDVEGLHAALLYSMWWTGQHYDEASTRDLTSEVVAEIEADSAAMRLSPFRARGTLVRVREVNRQDAAFAEYHGHLELEDGGHAAFVTTAPPEIDNIEEGDFVLLEGLFLQRHRFEGDDGWIEAPLLCGKRLLPSVPRANLTAASPTPLVDAVQDDRVGRILERPWPAEFELMARATVADDDTDWATVPELSTETINAILEDGDAYRGKPFRMPVSINLDARAIRVDENALRLDRITQIWAGNQTWGGSEAPAIKISLPEDRPELGDRYGDAHYLEAELYFLRNYVHENQAGTPGRTPWFVARSVTTFEPKPSPWPGFLLWGMLGLTVVLVLFIWALLRRERAQAARLQEELVRRRRARRAKNEAVAGEGGAAAG